MPQPSIIKLLSNEKKEDLKLLQLTLRSVKFHMDDHPRAYTKKEIRDKYDAWVDESLNDSEEA